MLSEKIKNIIIEMIQYSIEPHKNKFFGLAKHKIKLGFHTWQQIFHK